MNKKKYIKILKEIQENHIPNNISEPIPTQYIYKRNKENTTGYFTCRNCWIPTEIIIQDLSIIEQTGRSLSTCIQCFIEIKTKILKEAKAWAEK